MVARKRDDRRPRLAVMFNAQVPVLQLIEAAAGARQVIWLVDRSSADVDGSLRLLRRVGHVVDVSGLSVEEAADLLAPCEPDGILAFDETELMRAAAIGACLELPVQPRQTVTRLTNKLAQREALLAARLPIPQFRALPAGLPAGARAELCRAVGYPAVVKPQEGSGSRNVLRVADEAAMRRILGEQHDPAVDLIIEEQLRDCWPRERYPYADFVSVESIVAHGRIGHLAITGRAALVDPFRETGNFIPAILPTALMREVVDVAGRAVAAMGADTGAFHTEVKVSANGPYVIEVNGRVGGSIPELFALATGRAHSLLDIVCRVALGEPVHVDAPVPCHHIGYSMFVPPPLEATRLMRLDHLDEVRRIPGIQTLIVNHRAGDHIDWREGYDGRLYTVYGVADDYDGMWAARRKVQDTVVAEFA